MPHVSLSSAPSLALLLPSLISGPGPWGVVRLLGLRGVPLRSNPRKGSGNTNTKTIKTLNIATFEECFWMIEIQLKQGFFE